MGTKGETLRFSENLVVGDNIKVGGMLCQVKKTESVFHYVPDASIRLELTIVGEATSRKNRIIVFFPRGVQVNIYI